MSKTLHGQYFLQNGATLPRVHEGRPDNLTISLVLRFYGFFMTY